MSRLARRVGTLARRLWRREDGNATIEFVIALPVIILIFTISCESALLQTRHVMLERGLDQTVRLVRIGALPEPDHDTLTKNVCRFALIIPECAANIRLEMIQRDPHDWVAVDGTAPCRDRRDEDAKPVVGATGGSNSLMILRVCALFDPILPGTGLGKELPQQAGGGHALIATSSFVVEPS